MQLTRRGLAVMGLSALMAMDGPNAQAASLEFTSVLPSAPLNLGERFVVRGQLTNLTGQALRTSEVGLSFAAFDPMALQITPLLGDPDVNVPNRSLSALLDLFEVEVLLTATAGVNYSFEWFGFDASGVFSPVYQGSVQVAGSPVPLPSTLLLAAMAAALALRQGARRPVAVRVPSLSR
jgi:hypothetical protein